MSYTVNATFLRERIRVEGSAPIAMYVVNASLTGEDYLYYTNYNQDVYGYGLDGNGNVGQLVNAADGVIAASYEYDPYGNTTVADGVLAGENPFRFSSKYLDTETDLYYYGYRYYSAQ